MCVRLCAVALVYLYNVYAKHNAKLIASSRLSLQMLDDMLLVYGEVQYIGS